MLGGCLVALMTTAGTSWAQSYALTEAVAEDGCARYRLAMNLSGELRVARDDRPAVLKLTATATHVFAERVMVVTAGLPQKTARAYDTARAVIEVDGNRSERSLAPEHMLLVVQKLKDVPMVYCPKGALTSPELELTHGHFDTLALLGLLPGKAVAVNESWKIPTGVAQGLCHLEGVTSQDLVAKLSSVKDDVAVVSVLGSVNGIDLGAPVKMTVQASYRFDLKAKHLSAVEWKEKDERGQGPASPASTIETTYTVERAKIEQPEKLGDVALISVPEGFEVPEHLLMLTYRDPKSRFALKYARDWQTVGQTDDHLVMRLMERGDFVAQATITPWIKAKPGEHLSPEEFRKAMANTPGWTQSEVLQAGEVEAADKKRYIYRMSAVGTMDDMKLIQNFYLIAWPNGEQLVLAFTLTPAQADKLGGRDQAMVINADLPR
jgi:hypothetical protein